MFSDVQVKRQVDLVTVAGTRPDVIKLSILVQLLNKGHFNHALLYTGQHFSPNMKDVFLDELGIKPDYDMKMATSEVSVLKKKIQEALRSLKPRFVILYGDTNSTMAGALAAHEENIPIIHLEAGIRDLDITVPEEKIRIYIDSISDYMLAPTALAETFLEYEDVPGEIQVTGNLIHDVSLKMSVLADKHVPKDLPKEFLLLTMHRQENVDDSERLVALKRHLESLPHNIVFPVHPRTQQNMAKHGIRMPSNVHVMPPLGYLSFLSLLKNCKLVLTDSGGVTEEAIILKKPCITLRHSTARWETVLLKANILFPLERKDPLSDVVHQMMNIQITKNPYGEDVANTTLSAIEKIMASETIAYEG